MENDLSPDSDSTIGKPATGGWLNRTVLGIGLASLFSDWSHEIATASLPTFLATMGVAAAWLGLIEGIADGFSSFAKMGSGYYTDKLARRKPIAVIGYLVTGLGTAAFGMATAAWHVLLARTVAWLGRGVRTPVRKALLAGAATKQTLGRAFGFERMMDTLGAIVGPASALFLLHVFHHHYSPLFAITLVPSLAATLVMVFLVKENTRTPVPHISFGERLRGLPPKFRRLLIAVGVFGLGAFAHSLLILLATQRLTSKYGVAKAASLAVALYVLHNVFYASFAFIGGWLGDRFPKNYLLALGYFMAAIMAVGIIVLPINLGTLALIFVLGGTNVALEETLEDSLAAELVPESHHGIAFGTLATVNGIGDLLSSVIVGALWSGLGIAFAFGYSAILSATGAFLVLTLKSNVARVSFESTHIQKT